MLSTERGTCDLHPPAESLNTESEIFPNGVSLESSKGVNCLPTSSLLPSSSQHSSYTSAGDRSRSDDSNDNSVSNPRILRCDYLPIPFRLRNLSRSQETYLLLFRRPDVGLLH